MEILPWRKQSKTKLWTLSVVLIAFGAVEGEDKLRCGPGLITPGVTVPTGDILIEYGSPLEILCMLNPEVIKQGLNSSNLIFQHYTNERGGNFFPVEEDYISVINETTSRLYIEKPMPMKEFYQCLLVNGTDAIPVCLNSVHVGFRPLEVLNFSCVSHNWDNLSCTWAPPVNYVNTNYTLAYYLGGRAGGRWRYGCPGNTDLKKQNYCFWDHSTSPPYRQPHRYYYFVMTGQNVFGNITTKIKFHHYAHVIPAKATGLTVLEKTMSSVLIQWSVVLPMYNFPPGVEQMVKYMHDRGDGNTHEDWQVADTSSLSIKTATHQLNITGLKYANSPYDFRVFMRSAFAVGDDMWSQPATITTKTKPTVPGAAPKTDIGSFEVYVKGIELRDIYVYWQQIPKELMNGDNFHYKVDVEEEGIPKNLPPSKTTHAYAEFTNLKCDCNYRFIIYSVNQEGHSREHSEVFVPAYNRIIGEPSSFTKIAFDQHIYELSWKPPELRHGHEITSYTIFWCDNSKDRPYQCEGTLNWTKVSQDITIKNITVPDDKIYQFAISANSKNESSGMFWASCTVIHNKILGKMKSVWINRIGSTFIEVGWKLECSDRIGVVTGFRISYCPIESPDKQHCKVEAKNETISGDGRTILGNVTNLTPYTTYMVMVAVVTKDSVGQWSDHQLNTTLEAAPDIPPQNLTVSDITNTSMVITWTKPHFMNGVLRYYLVYYNDQLKKVEGNQNELTGKVKLNYLKSFTLYNISVSACTVACSAHSEPLLILTSVGNPGNILQPVVKAVNYSIAEVTWKAPQDPGGELNRYEILVKTSDDEYENNTKVHLVSGNQTRFMLNVDCEAKDGHHYYVYVRAVNLYKNKEYLGPWSERDNFNCLSPGVGGNLLIFIWIMICMIGIGLLFGVVFLVKQVWERYIEMRAVEVKLPPGLASIGMEKSNDPDLHNHLSLYGWGPPPGGDKQDQSPPDQERLLQKKGGGELEPGDHSSLGEGDGDSSGCSSGHESVASSLTAGTHISSDSGTEADQLHNQRATSLDQVFSDSVSSGTSLRQRNKASSSSGSDNSGSSRWDHEAYVMLGGSTSCLVKSTPNLNEGEAGGYSLFGSGVGVNGGWRPTAAATGYVSLPPSVSMPPPYVAHPPCWPNKEPTSPSKGYVMAGEGGGGETLAQYCRLGHSDYVPHRQLDSDL